MSECTIVRCWFISMHVVIEGLCLDPIVSVMWTWLVPQQAEACFGAHNMGLSSQRRASSASLQYSYIPHTCSYLFGIYICYTLVRSLMTNRSLSLRWWITEGSIHALIRRSYSLVCVALSLLHTYMHQAWRQTSSSPTNHNTTSDPPFWIQFTLCSRYALMRSWKAYERIRF